MLHLDGSSYPTVGLPTLVRENDPESMLILTSLLPWRHPTDVFINMENSVQQNTVIYYVELMCK